MGMESNPLEGFELYIPPKRAGGPQAMATVSVLKTGQFTIAPDLAKHLLPEGEEISWVQLGFNPRTRQVVIIPTDEDAEGALKLTRPHGYRYMVDARRFLQHFSIQHDKRQALPATWDESKSAILFTMP